MVPVPVSTPLPLFLASLELTRVPWRTDAITECQGKCLPDVARHGICLPDE